MSEPIATHAAYPPAWPPAAPPRRKPWIIPAAIVVAVIAAAAMLYTAWQIVYESPYERCHRIIRDYHLGLFDELSDATGGHGNRRIAEGQADESATKTCDYLRARDRLGEADEESALYLWMEAETGVRLPAGDRSS